MEKGCPSQGTKLDKGSVFQISTLVYLIFTDHICMSESHHTSAELPERPTDFREQVFIVAYHLHLVMVATSIIVSRVTDTNMSNYDQSNEFSPFFATFCIIWRYSELEEYWIGKPDLVWRAKGRLSKGEVILEVRSRQWRLFSEQRGRQSVPGVHDSHLSRDGEDNWGAEGNQRHCKKGLGLD